MFMIIDGLVFKTGVSGAGASYEVCIGNEVACKEIETDTQIIYQWQKFNIDTGVYENDTTNTTIIFDSGQNYTPINGQVVVDKLPEVKVAKIARITDLYNQKLSLGFISSATGTDYTFGYGATDQMKFMQLAILVLSGKAIFSVNIPAKDNTVVSHTQEQYNQLLIDIAVFAQAQNDKLHDYINVVNACRSINEVNTIAVAF